MIYFSDFSVAGGGGGGGEEYWRVDIASSSGGASVAVAELGFRTAYNSANETIADAFASSEASSADNAFDGNKATVWDSAFPSDAAPWHLGAQLASSSAIAAVYLRVHTTTTLFPTALDVASSPDGSSYTSEWTPTGATEWRQGESRVFCDPGALATNDPIAFGNDDNWGSGAAQCVWSSEHYASYYFNTAGVDVDVEELDFLNITSAGGNTQLALYADNSGAPGTRLGVTNTITGLGTGDQTFTMSSPVTIASGAKVWVAARSTGNISCGGAAGIGSRYNGLGGSTAFADPYGSSSSWHTGLPIRLRGVVA